jgi:hypothetical protein
MQFNALEDKNQMLAVLPLVVPIGVFTTLWAIAAIHGRITVVWFDGTSKQSTSAGSVSSRNSKI